MTRSRRGALTAGVALASVALGACSGLSCSPSSGAPAGNPALAVSADAGPPSGSTPRHSEPQAPEPRRSFLMIARIGLHDYPVVRYRGRPDDARGTVIQNRGPTASPRGPRGGVGPGEIGNLIVTGHRTSHAAPFADLPVLEPGHRVRVRSGDAVYVYEIIGSRLTSFRSEESRRRQEAPVPGKPGTEPTRAMVTLSTCATPEDHAAGNFWADRFGNPEHRIDKIGVLVRVDPASG